MMYGDYHVLWCVIDVFLVLLLAGLTIRWCWVDARRRGKSPLLVFVLVVFFFPLGLVVWLLFRPERQDGMGTRGPFRLQHYRVQ